VYFASVREAIGLSSEECDVPQDARSVGDLVAWISAGS
jgi:molybdopterin converting factor small subunit